MEKNVVIKKLITLFEQLIPNDVKLETQTLETGEVIEYADLNPGTAVNVIAEDGTKTPINDGEYNIKEGLLVTKGGVIVEVISEVSETEENMECKNKKNKDKSKLEIEANKKTNETNKETNEVKTEEVKMNDEIIKMKSEFEKQINDLKASYELKLSEQKKSFESKVLEALEELKKSEKIILNKEEVKKPLTVKDMILREYDRKKNN